MKIDKRLYRMFYYLTAVIIGVSIMFSLYYVSLPEKYLLNVGDASPYDINAIRAVNDMQETFNRANAALLEVPDIMIENKEIKNECIDNITSFFNEVRIVREKYYLFNQVVDETEEDQTGLQEEEETIDQEEVETFTIEQASEFLKGIVLEKYNEQITLQDSEDLILLEEPAFESFYDNAIAITETILSSPVTAESLSIQIQSRINQLSERLVFYSEKTVIIEKILLVFLKSNLEYNRDATDSAKKLAYNTVMENPVMIPRGTRIVNFGETITAEKYTLIKDMGLIETGEFDYRYFSGIALLVLLISGIIALYTSKYEKHNIVSINDKLSLLIALLIPFVLSLMLANISNLIYPVYISAVLVTAYFGFRTGIVMSFLLTFLILPVTGFDSKYLLVTILGCVVASLFTIGISKRNNYALIIIATAMTCFLASITFNVLIKTTIKDTFMDSGFAVLSGSISVIFALGIMPLFEMIFNSVSPLRLVELSQPGNPLLRRLFIEAPGTSQHSVMVGNLAEAGATAIGANALIARVGAYYHDVGKLENPEMFIENQEGINPHDKLSPEESSAIIISHTEAGLRIAKKYKLPDVICKIIYEHHGNANQLYFLRKAQEYAKINRLSAPDTKKFMYTTPKPSSKEAGVLMLADTVEAAMKSAGISEIVEAEKFIRELIKQKIMEEQLTESGLSFKDTEVLIQSFLHVYSGHFRKRVRYPSESGNLEQPEKV